MKQLALVINLDDKANEQKTMDQVESCLPALEKLLKAKKVKFAKADPFFLDDNYDDEFQL